MGFVVSLLMYLLIPLILCRVMKVCAVSLFMWKPFFIRQSIKSPRLCTVFTGLINSAPTLTAMAVPFTNCLEMSKTMN